MDTVVVNLCRHAKERQDGAGIAKLMLKYSKLRVDAGWAPRRLSHGNERRVLSRHVRLVLSYSQMYCRVRYLSSKV